MRLSIRELLHSSRASGCRGLRRQRVHFRATRHRRLCHGVGDSIGHRAHRVMRIRLIQTHPDQRPLCASRRANLWARCRAPLRTNRRVSMHRTR